MARMVTLEDHRFYDLSRDYFLAIGNLLRDWTDSNYTTIEQQLKEDHGELRDQLREIDARRNTIKSRMDTIDRIRGSLFAARDIHKNFTQDFEKEN